ncbi:MAG: hypothetical protein ACTHNN_11105 [Xanthobacteraceae bacterium]
MTGATAYGVVSYIESDPPQLKVTTKSPEPALTPRAALRLSLSPDEQFNDTTPLISLSRPQDSVEFDKPTNAAPSPSDRPPVKDKHLLPARAIPPAAKPPPPPSGNVAMVTPHHTQQTVQWRAVPTANASYFNLGGHINGAGIVDSVASEQLREAFKVHRNFNKLPPDIRTHILTQNISLPKIAPYRGLLGINDKTIEREQAVRFERVGDPRGPG